MSNFVGNFKRDFERPFAGVLGRRGGVILGAELALPALSSGTTWIASGGATGSSYTGGQAVFLNATSTAVVELVSITGLDDNRLYQIETEVVDYVQGQVRIQVYGDTANHLGTAGPYSQNGTFVAYVRTENTGTFNNRIRIQTNGPSTPGNTLKVVRVSVKPVL